MLLLLNSQTFWWLACSIYPSQEQDLGQHIPISNNTGSLPDLTVLHFPSPLTTPLDAEDGGAGGYGGTSSPSSLSPTSPHHMAMPPPANPQSPATRRRHVQGVPSPLVLNNANQMRVPLSPPVSTNIPVYPCHHFSNLKVMFKICHKYYIVWKTKLVTISGGGDAMIIICCNDVY